MTCPPDLPYLPYPPYPPYLPEKKAMRLPFIAANWKMFKTVHESVVFVKELRLPVKDVEEVEIVIAPPFTAIHAAAEAARNTNIGVAGQDVYWERDGGAGGRGACAYPIALTPMVRR